MKKLNGQAKSRKRIADHGEVFTAEREVNAMLDLVKQETERIDSRFLEPACGTGNFLTEILNRKLRIVKNRYYKNRLEYKKHVLLAITSIYGVDVLEDNILECRERLFNIFYTEYTDTYKEKPDDEYAESIKFILSRNILHGDALSMKTLDGEPIIFSEWSLVTDNMIKRRDYRFDELLEGTEEQISVFSMGWEYDDEIKAFIPAPIEEYPVMDYRRLRYAE